MCEHVSWYAFDLIPSQHQVNQRLWKEGWNQIEVVVREIYRFQVPFRYSEKRLSVHVFKKRGEIQKGFFYFCKIHHLSVLPQSYCVKLLCHFSMQSFSAKTYLLTTKNSLEPNVFYFNFHSLCQIFINKREQYLLKQWFHC